MGNINSTADIIEAIRLLEIEQEEKGQLLKEQFNITYETVKPVNILKSAVKEFYPLYLPANIIGAASGLAAGVLFKNRYVGTFPNIFRRLAGTILQYGIIKVARRAGPVKSVVKSIFHRLFHKKEVDAIGSSKALLSSSSTQLKAEPADSFN